MLPTRRGWAVLAASTAAVVAGWLLGLPEATAVGVGGVAMLAAGGIALAVSGRGPEVTRTARPARVTVGDPCQIVLEAHNASTRRTPVTAVTDSVGDRGTASALLAPIAAGGRTTARYSLATARRGLVHVGPLRRRAEDPFGLVSRSVASSEVTTVVVLPRVVPLDPLPAAVGDEPELGVRSMAASSTVDEELTGLREYVPGDDVRRIHWPTTARTGAPTVRQFEVPWQHRTTLLVDLRSSVHDEASLERAVTVAASVVALAASGDELLRLGTTTDPSPPFVVAAPERERLLERLAVVEARAPRPGDGDALVRAIEQATRSVTGRLVVCTGGPGTDELQRVAAAADRAGSSLVVTTAGAVDGDAADPGALHWDGTTDLATLWRTTVAAAPVAAPAAAAPSRSRR